MQSVILVTTKLPDGQQLVETLTAYVAPTNVAVATQGVQRSSSAAAATPTLQSKAVSVGEGVMKSLLAVVVGVVGLTVFL